MFLYCLYWLYFDICLTMILNIWCFCTKFTALRYTVHVTPLLADRWGDHCLKLIVLITSFVCHLLPSHKFNIFCVFFLFNCRKTLNSSMSSSSPISPESPPLCHFMLIKGLVFQNWRLVKLFQDLQISY